LNLYIYKNKITEVLYDEVFEGFWGGNKRRTSEMIKGGKLYYMKIFLALLFLAIAILLTNKEQTTFIQVLLILMIMIICTCLFPIFQNPPNTVSDKMKAHPGF
jgi:uncharacterized membrane protein YhaH (DUF805 family)